MADAKLSREDFKRQKAIEEQRKAGTLPAEVDPETGQDINPHIPHYISQAPWYLDINHPTLKHQRTVGVDVVKGGIDDWYDRGKTLGTAKKYRKGACENCGAMTHKTKDCLDRPRRVGAKFTRKNIAADEAVQSVNLGFEAKRDRWNGYDPSEHSKIVEEWELIDMERQKIREQKAKEKLTSKKVEGKDDEAKEAEDAKEGEESGSDDEQDEDKYADAAEAVGQKLDAKTRTTVRNLRIREDTAKYLLNLDVNSAYYDPKTRSMRDNPVPEKDANDLVYAGDNFVRWTGDAPNMAKLQAFAWQAEERGKDVHLNANPTQGELLFQEYQKKKEKVSESQKDSILATYGGSEYLQAPPKELLLAQSESYVEYSQTGKVIKGQEKAKVRSKYEEDSFPLNHTAVWGSYWVNGKWGFACCHLLSKHSYCTGVAGIEAEKASAALMQESMNAPPKTLLEANTQKIMKGLGSGIKANGGGGGPLGKRGRGERLGEGEVSLDDDKLKKALEKEELRKKAEEEPRKKGKYSNQAIETETTEEELEAFRLKKAMFNDPMANYVDREDE
ncbi:mRNA splicing protein [Irineochytrium annulatum]|nr:mRNA splicing protein [Irineochytrium annulatum]